MLLTVASSMGLSFNRSLTRTNQNTRRSHLIILKKKLLTVVAMRTVFCKSTDWKIPLTQFREVLQSDKLLVLRLLLLLHCCLVSVLVSDMQILIFLLHDGSPLKAFLEIKLLKILDSLPLPPLKKTSAYHIPAFSWQLLPHSSVLQMAIVVSGMRFFLR